MAVLEVNFDVEHWDWDPGFEAVVGFVGYWVHRSRTLLIAVLVLEDLEPAEQWNWDPEFEAVVQI